jgi:hypothetical protein
VTNHSMEQEKVGKAKEIKKHKVRIAELENEPPLSQNCYYLCN